MKTVGIRELKNSLSTYVREAKDGETIVVTDRGEPVAQLAPIKTLEKEHPFAEMARRGEATIGRPLSAEKKAAIRARRRGPPILQGITTAEILDALREDTR
ncbi:MAG: type II toxin-antitoxin system prevent-host-death family antitoxin [Rhizomicrobium sp.]